MIIYMYNLRRRYMVRHNKNEVLTKLKKKTEKKLHHYNKDGKIF